MSSLRLLVNLETTMSDQLEELLEAQVRIMGHLLDAFAHTLHVPRRERIATACLAGLLADPRFDAGAEAKNYARAGVTFADALIAELDKEPTK